MARLPLTAQKRKRDLVLTSISFAFIFMYHYVLILLLLSYKRKCWKIKRRIRVRELRSERLYQLIRESDVACISELCMDRKTFDVLCEMLRAAIYRKDIVTGEGAEGLVDAVINMEKEVTLETNDDQEVEDDRMSRETPPRWASDRNSVDSTSSSSKRRKKIKGNEVSKSSDPFLDMASDLRDDLKNATASFGKMAEAMERQAKAEEEARHEDPMEAVQKKFIDECTRLGFVGSELLKAAAVFVKVPN